VLTVAELAWYARGCEPPEGVPLDLNVDLQPCYLCGLLCHDGCLREKAILETFNQGPEAAHAGSNWVCRPCVWSMKNRAHERTKDGELSPGGKTKRAPWLRVFTVFAWQHRNNNHCLLFTKAEKSQLRSAIEQAMAGNPNYWGLCLADSGQKQLMWRTPINRTPTEGALRIEEQLFTVNWRRLWPLVDQINALREFYTIAEIESGDYSADRILQHGVENYQAAEKALSGLRGGMLLTIAIWFSLPFDRKAVAVEPQRNSSDDSEPDPNGVAGRSGQEDNVGSDSIRPESVSEQQRDVGQSPSSHVRPAPVEPKPVPRQNRGEQGSFGW
jgi:hypothetical protein